MNIYLEIIYVNKYFVIFFIMLTNLAKNNLKSYYSTEMFNF